MKAIIMAGGEGSRLRPLTCTVPKPMMRLMDKPLMEYALELLKRHGIEDIAVTLGYLPDAVTDYFDDGQDFGVRLRYYAEKTPLGTAGGVGQARDFLDETFIVLSGDGLTDLNLAAALDFHREKRALATLVLKQSENPLEYGVVLTDAEGRVRNFYEKPGWEDALSDTINTGIYILEPEALEKIPPDRPFDFARDLFPALLAAGAPLYGYVAGDYWCDVGDPEAYLRAHADVLEGKVQLPSLLALAGQITVRPGAQVDRRAILEGPCCIGERAEIHSGARVGALSVVGREARVEAGADVKRSLLLRGARLGPGAQARGCVLGPGSLLEAEAQAYEGSVLGPGASLGARAVLAPGIRVWPGKQVPAGRRQTGNLVWGANKAPIPSEGIPLDGPDQAVRAAQAWVGALAPAEVALAQTGSAVSAALWQACAAGLAAQGVQVLDAGVAPLPQLRHILATGRLAAAALVREDSLLPLDTHGAPISQRAMRSVSALLARQDYAAPFSGIVRPALRLGRSDLSYAGRTSALFAEQPRRALAAVLFARRPPLLALAERTFLRAGLTVRAEWEEELMALSSGEMGLWLSDDGEEATLSAPEEAALGEFPPMDENMGRFNEAEMQLMRAWIALERGEKHLLERVSATRALEALAERYGAEVEFTPLERAVWLDKLAVAFPTQFLLHTDGVALGIMAFSALARAGLTAAEWRRAMPQTHRLSRSVPLTPAQRGRVLRSLTDAETSAETGGGLRFPREGGWAWVCPDETGTACRIVSEAPDAEFAKELCDFYENAIRKLRDEP